MQKWIEEYIVPINDLIKILTDGGDALPRGCKFNVRPLLFTEADKQMELWLDNVGMFVVIDARNKIVSFIRYVPENVAKDFLAEAKHLIECLYKPGSAYRACVNVQDALRHCFFDQDYFSRDGYDENGKSLGTNDAELTYFLKMAGATDQEVEIVLEAYHSED